MYDDSSGSDLESPASGSLQLTIVSFAISGVAVCRWISQDCDGYMDSRTTCRYIMYYMILYFISSVIIIILLVRRWWRRWHDEPAAVIATWTTYRTQLIRLVRWCVYSVHMSIDASAINNRQSGSWFWLRVLRFLYHVYYYNILCRI